MSDCQSDKSQIVESTAYAWIYFASLIFCESGLQDIPRVVKFAIKEESNHGRRSEKSVSFTHLYVHCTTSIAYVHKSHSCVGIGGKFIFACC